MKQGNPWISIADLLSSIVLVLLLLFVLSAIAPKYSQEAQRQKMMTDINNSLLDYEERGQLRINQNEGILEFTAVTFSKGSAEISTSAKPLISDIAVHLKQYMTEHPSMEVLIEGHTDPSRVTNVVNDGGYYENNIQLSTLRAANVRSELLQRMGDDFAKRIGVAGYGSTRLKNKEDPLSAENRRIEIRLLLNGNEK